MVARLAMTGAEEQAMQALFSRLVHTTEQGQTLRRDVAEKLARAICETEAEVAGLVDVLDDAVRERDLAGPSALFPLFFP